MPASPACPSDCPTVRLEAVSFSEAFSYVADDDEALHGP